MSEAVRGVTSSGHGPPAVAPQPAAEPSTAAATAQRGGQPGVQPPASDPLFHKQQQQQQQHVESPPAAAEEDEQFKYHQQMLYPTPGLRNYGFNTDFMLYRFKVEPCKRQEKHARGSCPFAHPGDVAQRRPPDTYQALLCPEVRAKKVCPRANDCQCSHSAFEFWLHPDRYRTSMCEKGERCSRPVCFFAHNQKELRPLPAGLKPAVPTPEEAAKRHGSSRAGSITGMVSSPRDLTGFPAGLQAPTFAREAMPGMYMQTMQGMGLQGRQFMQQRPGMAVMGQGYAPAGYMPAGYAGASVGYRPMQAPPALDVSMQGQYGAVVGAQYMSQSPVMSPNTGLQTQNIGSPLMVPTAQASGAAGAAGQQFSPVGARGSQSSGGTSSAGGVWQQQQQAQAQAGRPAAANTPSAGSMQLPEAMLQQFQQLGVGGTAVAPGYDAGQPGMMGSMQPPAAQYAQQPMMYMQQGADQGWVQPQMPLQQARQQQVQYGLQQYAAPGMESQRSAQAPQQQMAASPLMGRMLPAQMPAQMSAQMGPAGLAPQQQVPAGAYAMQGDAQAALAQPWGAGPVGGVLDPSTALMQQPAAGQTTYETQTGW